MTDLNTLIGSSPLTLTDANDINLAGQITGGASNPSTGDSPGVVAIPSN